MIKAMIAMIDKIINNKPWLFMVFISGYFFAFQIKNFFLLDNRKIPKNISIKTKIMPTIVIFKFYIFGNKKTPAKAGATPVLPLIGMQIFDP